MNHKGPVEFIRKAVFSIQPIVFYQTQCRRG